MPTLTFYRLARRAWHLVPAPIRTATRGSPLVRALKQLVVPTHDDLYDADYYRWVDETTAESAPAIVESILRDLAPRTLLDVGCGTGAVLVECRRRGIAVRGLEYSEAGLALCLARGLSVTKFDLEADRLTRPKPLFDVVLSTEVAEHLPERLAAPFVDALVSQARTVVFSAATPGQGGVDHVNEQPHSYWIARFQERGFRLDEPLSLAWRKQWAGHTATWYSDNIMIFRQEG
jgi:SAM-dependent methyltransferase